MSLDPTIAVGVVALGWWMLAVRSLWAAALTPFVEPDIEGGSTKAIESGDSTRSSQGLAVVIPARNERKRIGGLLEDLAAQTRKPEVVIVVDDRSTDGTTAVLESWVARGTLPLKVIHGRQRPPGWVGKTWAIHQGTVALSEMQATESGRAPITWIAFIDADARLHPHTLEIALGMTRSLREDTLVDLISLPPGYRIRTGLQAAVGLALGHLLWQLYSFPRVNDPRRATGFAHGVFIMVRRSTYERIGGHTVVKGEIVEDILLAEAFKRAGGRLRVAAAPRLIETHAYGSWSDLIRGLRKNAFAGMDYELKRYITGAVGGVALAGLPWLGLAWAAATNQPHMFVWGGIGLAGQVAAAAPVCRYLRVPLSAGLLMFPGIIAYVAIATLSVADYLRGRVVWNDVVLPAPSSRSNSTMSRSATSGSLMADSGDEGTDPAAKVG